MIKLIAIDVDGTLVEAGNHTLDTRIYQVIRSLKERGIIFSVCSGRQLGSIKKLFAPIERECIFIAENGAYVECRGYEIAKQVMDWEKAKELICDLRSCGGFLTLSTKDFFYVEGGDEEFYRLLKEGYRYRFQLCEDSTKIEDDILKISLYKREGIREYAPALTRKWERDFHCTIAEDYWMDFMDIRSTKGNAVKAIQDLMKISPEETMVFGDSYNDLSMICTNKYSIAMGNAKEEVKEAAAYVTDTNVNQGVLQVLDKVVLGSFSLEKGR